MQLIFGQSFEEDGGDRFRDSTADQFQSEDMSTEQDVGDGAAEGAEEQPQNTPALLPKSLLEGGKQKGLLICKG
jgi:hypothetical protein